jgi:hypothetical protein
VRRATEGQRRSSSRAAASPVALGGWLAGEPVAAIGVGGAQALALGVELVVGEAPLVEAGAGLVQVGLGALARGLLLGVLGARLAVLGVGAVGARDLVAPADELALAGLRAGARHGHGEHEDQQDDDDDDGDDETSGHGGLPLSL